MFSIHFKCRIFDHDARNLAPCTQIYVQGALHAAGSGLVWISTQQRNGLDEFGHFFALEVQYMASGVPLTVRLAAYERNVDGDGAIAFDLLLPHGAEGTAVAAFQLENVKPLQFAPFPSLKVTTDTALGRAERSFCYGGDKAKMYDSNLLSNAQGGCGGIDGGPFIFGWQDTQSPTNVSTLLASPINSFHLNYPRISSAGYPAKLLWNSKRQDMVFCASSSCEKAQINSGYTLYAREGISPSTGMPLEFWYNSQLQRNCVTNSTVKPPYPGYANHADDGFLYTFSGAGRLPVFQFYNSALDAHMVAASEQGQAFAKAHGYVQQGILGYIDPWQSSTVPAPTLTFGVSGEVNSVPANFSQRNMLYFSQRGYNAAVDG